ncbi:MULTISPECIES: glycoside hydrolase family 6 protein [unclassified Solwaraspora]|uniref:glycoside hydrolase family 6 protein n=1 Tax=unclassified Solwaraspora TaxID=2627926 RepID=UPI00259B860C|nr:glycoside hydrolase family 6 protein [Solwaraspora sp. WMMA2056]WJK40219.1 glycoside hydrolase family 6 protein [Solwaraspora sp. WMMA2056]
MNFNPLRGAGRSRLRRGLSAAAAVVLGSGVLVVAATQASAAAGCRVTYTVNQWNTGFTANLAVTNLGDPLSSWNLEFDYSGNQRVTQAWNSEFTQSGTRVTLRNAAWNGSLGTNATVNPGFNASYSGTNTAPTVFRLNGVACTGTTSPTTGAPTTAPPTTAPPTTAPPTTRPPTTAPPTTAPPTSPPPNPGVRVDNPYVGADVYVNPIWSANVAAEPGGSRIANQPTGVWLDRTSAIHGNNSPTTGDMGLADHLNEALRQDAANGSRPLVFQVVIYNLPGRDCAALASNGELPPDAIGRYRTEYIDVIRSILNRAEYRNLRIVSVIEIDSLPNLVTNVGSRPTATPECDVMLANGNYVNGVGYALAQLGSVPNVYNYIDAGHHGWIGWEDNFGPSAQIIAQAAQASGSTFANVHGFITNTANYSALREPYITVDSTTRPSSWIDWNLYNDELSFAQAFRQRLVQAGFSSSVGMLIDTSRNGWGGAARPTGPSNASDLNTRINQSRIDRRIHKGNWCNQSGAGLGERPTAAPASGIDAYVWIKPPGESDGSSTLIPNDEGKGFDRMCDPTYGGNARNGNSATGALPNAPVSGHWFSAQIRQLMQNAYPPLS